MHWDKPGHHNPCISPLFCQHSKIPPRELGGKTHRRGSHQVSIEQLKAVHGKAHPAETGKRP